MNDTAAKELDARAETPVDRAMADIQNELDRLSHHVSRMRDRLERAMAPERPVESTPDADIRAVPSTSQVTDSLAGFARSLSYEADRIGIMLDRLEL